MNGKTALMIGRFQPLTLGHTRVINKMIETHENVVIGLGSTNKPTDEYNPFTPLERMKMIANVYGQRVHIIALEDIGSSTNSTAWVDFVLDRLAIFGYDPDTYFTGSKADAMFYQHCFGGAVYRKKYRFLEIIDREELPISATEVRKYLELNDPKAYKEWIKLVPAVNISYIDKHFKKVQND